MRRAPPLCTAAREIHPEIEERPRLQMRPTLALQLAASRARSDVQRRPEMSGIHAELRVSNAERGGGYRRGWRHGRRW